MAWLDTWVFPLGSVLLGGLGLLLLVRGLLGRRFLVRRTRGCRRCRYDMSATGGHTCPECGHTARHEGEHYAGRRRWPVAVVGLVLLIGAGVAAMAPGVRRDGWLTLLPVRLQARLYPYETNPRAVGRFMETLWSPQGRTPSFSTFSRVVPSNPSRPPSPAEDLRWERHRRTAWKVALSEVSDPSTPQTRVSRAFQVVQVLHRDRLELQDLLLLLERHGTTRAEVASLVVSWRGEVTATIAQARHEIFFTASPARRMEIAIQIATNPWGHDDFDLIGFVLADPWPTGESEVSSKSKIFRSPIPDTAWHTYADEVARGRWCNINTLKEGMSASPDVGQAAIRWAVQAPSEEIKSEFSDAVIESLRNGLFSPQTEYLSEIRSRFESERGWGLTDLFGSVIAHADPGAVHFFAQIATSEADHSKRRWAATAMREARFGRDEVCRFLSDQWGGERFRWLELGWILRGVEKWPETSFAPGFDPVHMWGDLLRRLDDADNQYEVYELQFALKRDFSIACSIAILRQWEQEGRWSTRVEEVTDLLANERGFEQSVSGFLDRAWQECGQTHRHSEGEARLVPVLRDLITRCRAKLHEQDAENHGF